MLVVVVVVVGVLVVVGGVVEVEVLVVVFAVVVVVELVVVFGAVVVVVVAVVVAPLQSSAARSATVDAPWFRTEVSVRLIVPGRFETALRSEVAACVAAPQLPELTADVTWSSAALRFPA